MLTTPQSWLLVFPVSRIMVVALTSNHDAAASLIVVQSERDVSGT
jgi:hypothetical protein